MWKAFRKRFRRDRREERVSGGQKEKMERTKKDLKDVHEVDGANLTKCIKNQDEIKTIPNGQLATDGNGTSTKIALKKALMPPVSKHSPFYNMNHPERGKALIFNFDSWENCNLQDLDLLPRKGSKIDRDNLGQCLRNLDFDVHTYNNLKNKELWAVLDEVQKEDHTDRDCLLVAIMTHGEKNHVYMSDGIMVPVNLIWQHFEGNECETLAGKPKIFIFQACRGKKYDPGVVFQGNTSSTSGDGHKDVTDAGAFSYVIPHAADIFVAFSCPYGQYAWRCPKTGSWFIQAICKILNERAYEDDLQSLFIDIAREVAIEKKSQTIEGDESHEKKQVSSTTSTLIRKIRLKPKKRPAPTLSPCRNGYVNANLSAVPFDMGVNPPPPVIPEEVVIVHAAQACALEALSPANSFAEGTTL